MTGWRKAHLWQLWEGVWRLGTHGGGAGGGAGLRVLSARVLSGRMPGRRRRLRRLLGGAPQVLLPQAPRAVQAPRVPPQDRGRLLSRLPSDARHPCRVQPVMDAAASACEFRAVKNA